MRAFWYNFVIETLLDITKKRRGCVCVCAGGGGIVL